MISIYDGLGSVVALSKLNGSTVEIAEQYRGACPERSRGNAFGNTKVYDGNSTEKTSTSQFIGNPTMFTGRRLDPETRTGSRTGLYYYRARMYDPELGRFMQTDPIGYTDSMNLYAYCGNNPVNWIDPWGLASSGSTITTPATRGTTKPIIPTLPGSGTRQYQFQFGDTAGYDGMC